jgi:CRP-like cAMP-binding protein
MPTIDVVAALKRSYLFEGMTEEQLAPVAAASPPRRYVAGEYLFRIGDPADEICVVASGEVKDCVVDIDGREVVHFIHGPGMTFGEPGFFSVERTRVVSVVAVRPTVLIRLERRTIIPFMKQYGEIKDRVLEALASNTRWQTTMISSLVTRPLAERLVVRLLELVDSSPERRAGLAATPKISQSMLAAMIGVSRENVNRALAALALDGTIRQEGGRYVLINEARLRHEIAHSWPVVARRDRRHDDEEQPPQRPSRIGQV